MITITAALQIHMHRKAVTNIVPNKNLKKGSKEKFHHLYIYIILPSWTWAKKHNKSISNPHMKVAVFDGFSKKYFTDDHYAAFFHVSRSSGFRVHNA